MCGIIGINSNRPVSSAIINSLKKLEYRGYDSAGIATLSDGAINEIKSEGRVDDLEKNSLIQTIQGSIGIGHVRWATHGLPNSVNAHPHSSQNPKDPYLICDDVLTTGGSMIEFRDKYFSKNYSFGWVIWSRNSDPKNDWISALFTMPQ